MCDECTWHLKTFLVQSLYWQLVIKLYCILYCKYITLPVQRRTPRSLRGPFSYNNDININNKYIIPVLIKRYFPTRAELWAERTSTDCWQNSYATPNKLTVRKKRTKINTPDWSCVPVVLNTITISSLTMHLWPRGLIILCYMVLNCEMALENKRQCTKEVEQKWR